MAIRLKIPSSRRVRDFASDPVVKGAVATFIIICTVMMGIFAFYYIKYQKVVDHRMRGQIFANASKIYARPEVVRMGRRMTAGQIANELRRAGYTEIGEKGESHLGTYRLSTDEIDIHPGPESFHSPEPVRIKFGTAGASAKSAKKKESKTTETVVNDIEPLSGGGDKLTAYELEPQLLTGLFDNQQRSKRRLITYDDIPKVLVDAVLAIEDRRFFSHSGVNYWRMAQVAWVDLREGRRGQGGSTITMQLSRGFFLTPEKTIKRKLVEMLIALELEQRFSKKQIFELYANKVDLGQRGSFTISGFGEGAMAYFGKDIKDVTLPEAALLAGILQRPSYLSPYRHADRALERRNLVLDSMVETGAITREQADNAKATPLKLAPPNVEASEAPYFVDLVKEQLLSRYSENELNENGYRIYTTIDPAMQKAAADAVDRGMKLVDDQITKLRTRRVKTGKGKDAKSETKVLGGPQAQIALVAMDPHTGAVVALVGGRNYGLSQLNHAIANRPTGSIFKPFVYAAALNTALSGEQPVFTATTMLDDSPTTFAYGDEIYEPRNYKEEYHGPVTARYALALSLNNATVKLAEMVGYDKVAALARAAGIKSVKATPAIALGAYQATPLDMASAYTVFANQGTKVSPLLLASVRHTNGDVVEDLQAEKQQVLDPRVAYVMTDMMAGVLNFGTAAAVRSKGFTAPAAGKTGTSHDAWFAGYTKDLLCVIWIGYDDYSDLRLSGAVTAAPIWADFMKAAVALPEYGKIENFPAPSGVVGVRLDKLTNKLSTPTCPEAYTAAYIAGTEPTETCDAVAGDQRGFFSKLFGTNPAPMTPTVATVPQPNGSRAPIIGQQAQPQPPEKKKGFFGRLFGGKDKDEKTPPATSPPATTPPAQTTGRPRQP